MFKWNFIAAVCAILLSSFATASAEPALWVVETPNSKVYLFGTVHVMKPNIVWHSTILDKALADSGDLWLEVANADDAAAKLLGAPLHFFADMPTDQQVAMLDATLDRLESTSTALDSLVTAWSAGDVDRFASLTETGMFKGVPGLYDTLVVNRNADWAHQLQQRLKAPGTSFIAVGAAHLAGSQSVQADLEKLGYHARRIQ